MSVTEQGSQAIRPTVRWTGHPFVDAGLAALATVSGVSQLEDLTADHLPEAVTALERVLLSDQALGLGVTSAFVRKGLSQIFPNSELVNPSNWKGETLEQKADSVRRKFRDAVAQELRLAQECLGFTTSNTEMCSTCGQRRPVSAMVTMRKDDLPLLAGIVNFYPAFDVGVRLCGLCALAVRFLPLSVMRTGVLNRLWILHTHAFPIARGISLQYGWIHFNQRIAANDALDFFKDWETAGDAGTVIYLLCDLLDRFSSQLQHLYRHPLPTTAYIFSNDNRSSHIQALLVPDSLLEFLAMLQILSPSAYKRFWRDLLVVPRTLAEKERGSRIDFVQKVAQSLLNSRAVLTFCLDHDTPKLSGGWMGHRLYLQEVLQMAVEKLAILERLGLTIARDPEAKRLIGELRTARWNEIHGILLRYVRQGWLSHEEFYTLLPPEQLRYDQSLEGYNPGCCLRMGVRSAARTGFSLDTPNGPAHSRRDADPSPADRRTPDRLSPQPFALDWPVTDRPDLGPDPGSLPYGRPARSAGLRRLCLPRPAGGSGPRVAAARLSPGLPFRPRPCGRSARGDR